MDKSIKTFNPEPWLRSILWSAVAVALLVTIYRGNPFQFSADGVSVKVGGAGQIDTAAPPPAPTMGAAAVQRDPAGTTFVSVCPDKTRAIGGSCTIKHGGPVALQNFGPELNVKGGWQFACVWGSPHVDGDAQAICLPIPSN